MLLRPVNILYDLHDHPGKLVTFLLAFQHLAILSGTLVYPVVFSEQAQLNNNLAFQLVSLTMLGSGMATIMLSLNRKRLGTPYQLFQGPSAVFLEPSVLAMKTGGMPLVYGMTFFSGLFQVFFSRFLGRMHRIFPPEIGGLVILGVGLSLVPTATGRFFGIDQQDTVTSAGEIFTAVITLFTIVGVNIWAGEKAKIYSIFAGIVAGYSSAFLCDIFQAQHFQLLENASLFALPELNLTSWSFEPHMIVTFKATGDMVAAQKISNQNWVRPNMNEIGKGVFASGLGNVMSSILGAMGQATSSSNIAYSFSL